MYLICDELILSQNFDTMQSDVMTSDGPINNVFLNYFQVLRHQEPFQRKTKKNHPTPMLYTGWVKKSPLWQNMTLLHQILR